MTSKFSIDNTELLQRISSGEAVVGIDFGNLIVRELAAFRLAAMDSESGCLPLDYLQGHKDGLGWAAQLAEANHPETGDWLYDDPIELAKAIRKGPDMPPVRPAADSEPVALQPELAKVIYHFRDWNEGFPVERFKADYVISWMLANYPPAPVVSADLLHTAASAIEDLLTTKDRMGVYVYFDLPFRLRSAANAQPAPAAPVCTCPSGDGSLRWPCPVHPGNSPVIPDGWTGNEKANAALMMLDRIETVDPVDDDRIDGIKRIVRELATAPHDTPALNSVQSVDSVADRWIPVSERMPERGDWLVTDGCDFDVQLFNGEQFIPGFVWEDKITHWMPLPAAPQEVK